MKWYCKKVDGKWRAYLEKKYCATDEDVCYGSAIKKKTAAEMVRRLNNPMHDDFKA